jgi:hypothetical protein
MRQKVYSFWPLFDDIFLETLDECDYGRRSTACSLPESEINLRTVETIGPCLCDSTRLLPVSLSIASEVEVPARLRNRKKTDSLDIPTGECLGHDEDRAY